MGIIKVLPDELVSKIAAGEVIERPASVVKELLENAVDAGATTLTVELKNGGIDLIKVRDNGAGILSEDVELAVKQHTTSKLYNEKELYEIATLGFRGEALHSIGIISELEIVTRHTSEEIGTIITVRGGRVVNKNRIPHDKGTTVIVSNLFFNVPARKKFLGSPQSEYRACLDVLNRFIFGYKDISIKLVHNSKEVFNIQSASLKERIILRIDQELKNKLLEISMDNGIVNVEGFISDPDYNINSSRFLYLFVNGRFIIDKSLTYSILNAYSTTLQKGRYPIAVLNLSVPSNLLDVNINPTKTAVKFADKTMIHELVTNAIKNALNERTIIYNSEPKLDKDRYIQGIKEATESYLTLHPFKKSYSQHISEETKGLHLKDYLPAPHVKDQQELLKRGDFSSLNIHAQFAATYIIASSENSVVIIDQHAMHERILFEQLLKNSQTKQRPSQFLTTPEEIFLNENRMSRLLEIKDSLIKLGYELNVDRNKVSVKAIPSGTIFEPLSLIELIDNSMQVEDLNHIELTEEQKTDPLYRVMATIACKSAVKAGNFLSIEKIKGLFQQLDELGIPLNCPHGRPFVLILPIAELEKAFHRR